MIARTVGRAVTSGALRSAGTATVGQIGGVRLAMRRGR